MFVAKDNVMHVLRVQGYPSGSAYHQIKGLVANEIEVSQ